MLPLEAANIVVDEFRANEQFVNYQVDETLQTQIDGRAGFKIMYSYQTSQNLKKTGIFYGVLVEDSLFFLHYEAPSRHYFHHYLSIFERMKESFRITL